MRDKAMFLNRELSWLDFDRRVLEEALDPSVRPLDRVKFLSIVASNLDEFFMVRVGGLQQLLVEGGRAADPAGLSPAEQLARIRTGVLALESEARAAFRGIDALLRKHQIRRLSVARLDPEQTAHVRGVFDREVFPVVTPIAVRSLSEVPYLPGLALSICVRIGRAPAPSRRDRFAVVAIPRNLPRLIAVPGRKGFSYVVLEDVLTAFLPSLFPGEPIAERVVFRLTRNADLSVREDLAGDLLEQMQEVLTERRQSPCVRVQVEGAVSPRMLALLRRALRVEDSQVYASEGPLDLAAFSALASLPGFDSLRERPPAPILPQRLARADSVLDVIAKGEVLLFHPYESFDPVLRLIKEAASDPDVLAIKQILYRTSAHSQVVAALGDAARRGKHVTALVELKARFDEARNIEWARSLETAGVQVIYGVQGLKTHAKVCIVVRREPSGVRRYVHFGTGNYNEITARLYSDISYMTCREEYAADASRFFNAITGYSQPLAYEKIAAAPLGLRQRLMDLIEGETQRATLGHPAAITAKMNSLVDPEIIRALYRASQAGVTVRLNVRGICCLRPGVRGLSERISVISIVDRFLEHARLFSFHHGGKPLVFISSADWMPRNIDRRIELLVPIEAPAARERLMAVLDTYFRDTVKARRLRADGAWERLPAPARGSPVRCQDAFGELTRTAAEGERKAAIATFRPHRRSS